MIAFIAFLACVWWLASALHTPTSAEIWYAEGRELARERERKERRERRKNPPERPTWKEAAAGVKWRHVLIFFSPYIFFGLLRLYVG